MAIFTNINVRLTGDMEKDFLQYKTELERRLRHLLTHIDLSSIVLGISPNNRLIFINSSGDLDAVTDFTNWIAGTTNQVNIANDGDGTVTISLPQNIDTNADIIFDSQVLNDLTPSRMVYADGSKKLQSIALLTNWIAGTSGNLTVTDDGDGSVTLKAIGSTVNVTELNSTSTLTVAQQGAIKLKSGSNYIVNLPTAVGNTGLSYFITNTSFGEWSITPSGTESILGTESLFIPSDYDGIETSDGDLFILDNSFILYKDENINICSDGADWMVR